jgi:hypothetical protein
MIDATFRAVAKGLYYSGTLINLSYNEMNILFYFVIIPLIWAYIIDRMFRFHYVKLSHLLVILFCWVTINDFSAFCDNLFYACVIFLNLFRPIGIDYVAASVLICVVFPIVFHMFLWRALKRKQLSRSELRPVIRENQ